MLTRTENKQIKFHIIKAAGADSAYSTSLICQAMEDMGICLYTPGTTGGVTYKVEFKREDFQYQEETDRLSALPERNCPCVALKESATIYAVSTVQIGRPADPARC